MIASDQSFTRYSLSVVAILLLIATTVVSIAADQTSARLWSSPESTQLVLESAKPLNYSISGLQQPARLVIDIQSTAVDIKALNHDIQSANHYLSAIRTARQNKKTLRIVFDLSAAIRYQVSRLKPIGQYQHRLVLDIYPQDPPDLLLALIEQLGAIGNPFVVLIDPGHGGEDPGAVSPNNNLEKNIVLQISRLLVEEINRRPGMQALLTRTDDRFIALSKRVRTAHQLNVDAFISIHADSVKSSKARGSSAFILSKKGASTRFARRLAEQANLSDLIGGALATSGDSVLDSALRQFSQDGKDRASRILARVLLEKISHVNQLHSKNVESAGFVVLKSPHIPSVLIETAFISNPSEEKKLLDKKFQQQLVEQIADALQQYRDQYHVQP